jgi:glyoxylate reductase
MNDRPKVLVTRMLPEPGMNLLKKHFRIRVNPEDRVMSREMLKQEIADKDGIVCLLTDTIDAEIISGAERLKIIASYAVGYNNIDLAEASKRRIPVTNTPDVLTEATADLTIGVLISIARRIVEADRYLRAGKFKGWAPELLLGCDVHGKKLGIIGIGRIGRAVAERAHGFGMEVFYYDVQRLPSEDEDRLGVHYQDFKGLLTESDFLTVHAPLNKETEHLISAKEFKMMKATAYLINVARGPIVDEKALVVALENKEIAGCALDVYENEPDVTPELLNMPNTVLVPHIGSASVEARNKMAVMVADNTIAVLVDNKRPPNIVNPEIYDQ